jgi:hypothetical protein
MEEAHGSPTTAAAAAAEPVRLLRDLPNRPTQRVCKLSADLDRASKGGGWDQQVPGHSQY